MKSEEFDPGRMMMPSLEISPDPSPLTGEQRAMRLVRAVQDLSLARDLDTIIDIVRRAARSLCAADGAAFVLRDGDKCYYVDEDAIGPLWKGQRFAMNSCISGWAMLNRRPAAIEDIYADERVPHDAYRPTFVKSLVMAPIRASDPIGAIGIYWAGTRAATEAEVELLQALADSTSVAMENVLLYRDLERRVEDRTRELAEANRELETFSYSVSHDLQAPLRHITSYSELLVKDHPESFDEESRAWLQRIQGSADTMAQLIQSLLRLSRFTRIELRRTELDLSRLAAAQAALLREQNPGRAVEIEIEPGLRANGDEELLRVVLQNLLANAWKFTSKRETAHISFGAAPQKDGSTAYFVRDDGAGFDMDNAEKLFSPFQRLHRAQDFPGSGVGLATVKRIVHRHGGHVWAEAKVNQGATFYFTLAHDEPPGTTFAAIRDGRG
jgi:signal transduction histidine kinase